MSNAKPLDRPEAPTGLHTLVTIGDHRSYTDAYVADLAACGFVPRSELEAAEVRVKAWDRAAIATAIKAMSSPERTLLLIDVVEDSSALAGRCVWCRYEGSSAYGCTRGESEADRLRTQLSTAEQRIRELEREVEAFRGKRFPVLSGGMTVPWGMVLPHEPQALTNHQQTLKRLAERGGLSWAELLCVLESRKWNLHSELTDEAAKPKVLALVDEYRGKLVPISKADTNASEGK